AEKLVRQGMTMQRVDAPSLRAKLASSGFYAKWRDRFGAQAWALLEKTSGKLARNRRDLVSSGGSRARRRLPPRRLRAPRAASSDPRPQRRRLREPLGEANGDRVDRRVDRRHRSARHVSGRQAADEDREEPGRRRLRVLETPADPHAEHRESARGQRRLSRSSAGGDHEPGGRRDALAADLADVRDA